jgi:hypothetical protein
MVFDRESGDGSQPAVQNIMFATSLQFAWRGAAKSSA